MWCKLSCYVGWKSNFLPHFQRDYSLFWGLWEKKTCSLHLPLMVKHAYTYQTLLGWTHGVEGLKARCLSKEAWYDFHSSAGCQARAEVEGHGRLVCGGGLCGKIMQYEFSPGMCTEQHGIIPTILSRVTTTQRQVKLISALINRPSKWHQKSAKTNQYCMGHPLSYKKYK